MKPSDQCGNCGLMRLHHWIANFADGQNISGMIFICPTAVFRGLDEKLPTPQPEPSGKGE